MRASGQRLGRGFRTAGNVHHIAPYSGIAGAILKPGFVIKKLYEFQNGKTAEVLTFAPSGGMFPTLSKFQTTSI
jgi:hypothetical protein